jgi:hypothetical protein
VEPASTFVPHCPQNRASVTSTAPQAAQYFGRGAPQVEQKRSAAPSSDRQLAQRVAGVMESET